jgi:hypothetical protein
MQATILRLRQLNEPVPRPLPRVTLDDVDRVERELNFKLPSEFIELQLGAGDVVFGCYEPVTLTVGSGHTYIVEVAQDAWASGVSREHLAICKVNGDYFCLAPNGVVNFWSHDGASSESWPSLEAWVRAVWLEEDAVG